jgi:hypothetical protein
MLGSPSSKRIVVRGGQGRGGGGWLAHKEKEMEAWLAKGMGVIDK